MKKNYSQISEIVTKEYYLFDKCKKCNNGLHTNIGEIEQKCNSCALQKYMFNKFNSIIKWVKTPIGLSIGVFLFILFIFIKTPNSLITYKGSILTTLITSFGFILVALKYKLDQVNYHKDLFEKRYKIFLEIDKILAEYFTYGKVTNDMIRKITGSLMRRSYFLFEENTYKFIAEFRKSLITINRLKKSYESYSETYEPNFKKQYDNYIKAEKFLNQYVDGQKLSDKFPELKINIY